MSVCAICHRTDVRYSVEHVIPEALGGCYVRKQMVCVDCNSKLGERVDAALVNHGLSKMFRLVHGLRGKAKKPPNPFVGEYRLRSDQDLKMRTRIGPGGRLIPYFLPEIRRKNLPDGRVGVTISVDRADEHEVEPIVRKIAKRLGGSAEEALGTMPKASQGSIPLPVESVRFPALWRGMWRDSMQRTWGFRGVPRTWISRYVHRL